LKWTPSWKLWAAGTHHEGGSDQVRRFHFQAVGRLGSRDCALKPLNDSGGKVKEQGEVGQKKKKKKKKMLKNCLEGKRTPHGWDSTLARRSHSEDLNRALNAIHRPW
jgi:hypothetical protein